jgi:transcriptional regulator with XRE-family HTH domain
MYVKIETLLDLLFKVVRKLDGSVYTNPEVADGSGVNYSTLAAIRSGRIPNPGVETLRQLSDFFNVSMDFFKAQSLDEARAIILRGHTNTSKVEQIALRLANLSEDAQNDILSIMNWVEKADQYLDQIEDEE